MALIDWYQYSSMLEELAKARSYWENTDCFTDFDEAIGRSCPELRSGEYGLGNLIAALREDFITDDDLVYEQIRLSALAYPATERQDLGEDWAGYFISSLADGTEVYSDDPHAPPSAWERVDAPEIPASAAPGTGAPETDAPGTGLSSDPETGLLYDDQHWYLKDGITIVKPVEGTDTFADTVGNRYRLGEIVLWYDAETNLLYDDKYWYLKDGATIVKSVEGTDAFSDTVGNWYRQGKIVLWYDAETGILYDDKYWYLKDGATIVEPVEGTAEFRDPKTGNRYLRGNLVVDTSRPADGSQAGDAPGSAAQQAVVAKLAAARERKVAELLSRLEAKGWTPADTEEEAVERQAAGDTSAMTREQLVRLLDSRVEQLISA